MKIDIEDIKRLTIKAGEILVVKAGLLATQERQELADSLKAVLPEGAKVIVLGPEMGLVVLDATAVAHGFDPVTLRYPIGMP